MGDACDVVCAGWGVPEAAWDGGSCGLAGLQGHGAGWDGRTAQELARKGDPGTAHDVG